MKTKTTYLLPLFFCMFLFGCSNGTISQSHIEGIDAVVTNVVDGDTIDVRLDDGREERVRLLLVDTPETKHPRLGKQPFGQEASDYTKEHLNGENILLEMDVSERDRYGRLLAYIWLGEENFNKTLVEKGLARVAIFPPDIKHLDEFEESQDQAREKGLGIWSIEDYVHDKGYRQEQRQEMKEKTPVDAAKGNKRSEDCAIKGNINSKKEKIYHMPGSRHYEMTKPEEMFCTKEEAEQAGFRAPKNK